MELKEETIDKIIELLQDAGVVEKRRVSCKSELAGSVLPYSIEGLVVDSAVPSLWWKATGKNYDSNKHPCVNDLRRFALLVIHHYAGKQNDLNHLTKRRSTK